MIQTQINQLFSKELEELWQRYKLFNKRPEYFPYNIKPQNQDQLLEFGLNQMIKSIAFIEAIYLKDPLRHNLELFQWIIYEWFSKSLKGDNQNILQKAKLLTEQSICLN